MLLVSLLLVVPGLVVPAFVRIFVDALFVGGRREWLAPLLLGMGLTALARGLLVWVQQYYLLRMETWLSLCSSSRLFWHVLRLPAEFFTQRYGGEIGSRVGLNDQVARLLSGDLAVAVLNVTSVGFYGAAMFFYDPALAAIGIFFALLNVMALRHVARRRMDANQRLFSERGKVMGAAMGGLQIIESLKAGGSESDFFARWTGHQANLARAEQELAVSTLYLTSVPPLLAGLNTALILAVGGVRVMEGYLTIGTLVALQSLMASFQAPVLKLVELGSTFQDVDGSLKRIDDVLRSPTDPHLEGATGRQGDGGAPPRSGGPGRLSDSAGKLTGHLELREVTFGYSPLDPPLLQSFSLTLRPGSRVALVGGSGSGKSTVARLVCGLFSPWEGEILLDGVPRRELPRARLCQSLAMVDQEIFLFEGTVRENLTLWNPTVPEADLIRAARDALLHDEISARPGSYDSRVEEGGANFSGGQRQRLEIARALVGDPSFLVLDEATSALDPITEKQIDDNLRRRGCTCLIVAHRLSTIRDCDEILVLERGQVVQRGTHEQMRRADGPYARLIETRERNSRRHLEIA
jgi:NHLM bacteriocin system ABC transporter peptidase/ATP-binding protein